MAAQQGLGTVFYSFQAFFNKNSLHPNKFERKKLLK